MYVHMASVRSICGHCEISLRAKGQIVWVRDDEMAVRKTAHQIMQLEALAAFEASSRTDAGPQADVCA